MKTLVTGANGLLGANVVRELESRGKEVRVIARPISNLTALKGTSAEIVIGDILDPVGLDKAMKGCDAVVHAAANTKQWPVKFEYFEGVNINGTKNVIRASLQHGIKRFVFVSTANAFGPGTRENPGTELPEFSGYRIGSGYVTSKFVAQQNVMAAIEKQGLPAVVVNPTFMLGPYDARPSSGTIIFMGLRRWLQFCPSGGKNFIHVRDAAAGVCNALEKGRIGECYLLAHQNLTYTEFFDLLNRVAKRHPARIRIPSSVIHAFGMAGSMIEKTINVPMPLNKVNARLLCMNNYYSGRKAVEELHLPQTPVEEAVDEAISWFTRQNML